MIRIHYFCQPGYTETGGIKPFLAKINPSVSWNRIFPPVIKPKGGKIGRTHPEPREHAGDTNKELIRKMFAKLEMPDIQAQIKENDAILHDLCSSRMELGIAGIIA